MKSEAIEFTVDGLTLRGNLHKCKTPVKKMAFLFLHGWTGKPNDNAAAKMAANGFSSMTFSLSGHNNSDGRIEDQTINKSLKQVLAAYDFFKAKLPEDTKIVAVGNSYGGFLSILLSGKRPVASLSLRVAANNQDGTYDLLRINQGAENPKVLAWRQQKLAPDATEALRNLHAFKGPIQIIEAELDHTVPHQCTQNYVDAVTNKDQLDYHLMKGWPHSMGDHPERNAEFQQMLLDWANKQ